MGGEGVGLKEVQRLGKVNGEVRGGGDYKTPYQCRDIFHCVAHNFKICIIYNT